MVKVLIIEDNADIRENTAELLELHNYSVITAEKGDAGFALAKKFIPDVILCDMMMPKSDGRKFLRLAGNDDIVREIPFVFFSADSATRGIRRAPVKESACLQKPFTEQQLLDALKKALDKN